MRLENYIIVQQAGNHLLSIIFYQIVEIRSFAIRISRASQKTLNPLCRRLEDVCCRRALSLVVGRRLDQWQPLVLISSSEHRTTGKLQPVLPFSVFLTLFPEQIVTFSNAMVLLMVVFNLLCLGSVGAGKRSN